MKLVAQFVVSLAVNAVALLIAAIALDRFTISELAFPVTVIIFTVVGFVARPVIEAMIEKHAQIVASFVGLAAAFVTLLVTDLVTDKLQIEGIGTWIVASLVIWIGRILADVVLTKRLTERVLGDRARA